MTSLEEQVATTVIQAVPQWFVASGGKERWSVRVGEHEKEFWCHRKPTWDLRQLLSSADEIGQEWVRRHDDQSFPARLDALQESLAIRWLELKAEEVDWARLIAYLNAAERRTYENAPIVKNIVISPRGTAELAPEFALDDPSFEKTLDPIASSPNVFLRVNGSLNLLGLGEVPWSVVGEPESYRLYPSFVHPIVSSLRQARGRSELSVHLTTRGDLVVMKHKEIIASRRKARWTLYDAATFKNSVTDIVGKYDVGARIVSMLFDLSYRRHGALLVLDPEGSVTSNLTNATNCIELEEEWFFSPELMSYLHARSDIRIAPSREGNTSFRMLVELASIDGATIFDRSRVIALGAMVRPHPKVNQFGPIAGARSTAAASAYLHGGIPFKVSSDGQVSIMFHADKSKSLLQGRGVISFL